MDNRQNAAPAAATSAQGHAPAYEPPGVTWEEHLEIRYNLAVSCAKIANTTDQCNAGPTSV